MRPPGAFKLTHRTRGPRSLDVAFASPGPALDPLRGALPGPRTQRILDSLRQEILEGGASHLRIRRIFETPREIFRLELELPDLGYQRVTLLDRDALEDLLATDDVRAVVQAAVVGG